MAKFRLPVFVTVKTHLFHTVDAESPEEAQKLTEGFFKYGVYEETEKMTEVDTHTIARDDGNIKSIRLRGVGNAEAVDEVKGTVTSHNGEKMEVVIGYKQVEKGTN